MAEAPAMVDGSALHPDAVSHAMPDRIHGHALIKKTLPFIRENRARSWWVLLSTTTLYAACLAVAAWPFFWPIRLAAAHRRRDDPCRLFIIYHDHQHGTILRGSWLANAIMTAFGVMTLNPPSTWNASHNHHHKHNGKIRSASIGSFPVMTVANYKKASRKEKYFYAFSRHWLTIFFAWFTVFLFAMTLGSLIRKPKEHIDCLVAVILHIALWVVMILFATPSAIVFAFIVPLTISSAMGAYLFYIQHNFPTVDLGDQSEWDYVFAALRSSSFLDTSRWLHWFTGNIGYHHIHHLNARIPFYRLPEAMKALPELPIPQRRTALNPLSKFSLLRLRLRTPINASWSASTANNRAGRGTGGETRSLEEMKHHEEAPQVRTCVSAPSKISNFKSEIPNPKHPRFQPFAAHTASKPVAPRRFIIRRHPASPQGYQIQFQQSHRLPVRLWCLSWLIYVPLTSS